ncbi:hypothetical protein EAG_04355 [Camponotus floridanus]|uniref:Uncharacterized protein n=1 Tax=Camponotus floridanus TaxID=104421 RepID=E2B220_CAMFO|nr:hypothetical protein EAG_04355 [Camponotus floridanus]
MNRVSSALREAHVPNYDRSLKDMSTLSSHAATMSMHSTYSEAQY